jgi:hypothetical protein
MAGKQSPKSARESAVAKAALDALRIEIDMEHRESEHSVTSAALRTALELAYDLGKRAGMS